MSDLQKILDGIEGLKGHVGETEERLKALVKQHDEEIVEIKTVNSSTAEKITQANDALESLKTEYEGLKGELTQLQAEGGRPGFGGVEARKSVGEVLTESDEYEAFKADGFSGKSRPAKYNGFFPTTDRKTLTNDDTAVWGSMGQLIPVQELGVLEAIQAPLTLRDLLPKIRATGDTVSFVEELGFANVYTELDANAASGASTITVKSVAGFFVGQDLEIGLAATPATKIKAVVSSINATTRVVTLAGTLSAARTANDPVTAVAIGMSAHGAQKPEANMQPFVERQYPIGTMAHYIVAHRQTLSDAPQLQGMVNQRLLFGLKQSEEAQILYGNGASPNLQGIMNNAAIQNHSTFPGTKDAGGVWRLDHIRKAKTLTQLAQLPPTDAFLHPNDFEDLELAKNTTNDYTWVTVPQGGGQTLWRINFNVTTAIREGEFLLGNFQQGGYLLDREDANVRFSDQHKDFFTSNMVAILAEERLGLAIVRPQAFTKGSWA